MRGPELTYETLTLFKKCFSRRFVTCSLVNNVDDVVLLDAILLFENVASIFLRRTWNVSNRDDDTKAASDHDDDIFLSTLKLQPSDCCC
jgi:hypothetical protein